MPPRVDGSRSPAAALYWLGAAPLVLAGSIDVLRARTVGPMTALGAMSIAEAVLAGLVFLFCARYPRRVLILLIPYAIFLGWAIGSTFWMPPDTRGAQNLVAYALLGLTVASGATLAALDPERAERTVDAAVLIADVGGLGLIGASLALRGWPVDIDRVPWFVHPRAAALMGLAPLAWHLARWAHGRARDLVPIALWIAGIFITLSRMATLTAFVLLGAALLLSRRFGRAPASGRVLAGLGLAGAVAAVILVGPFRDRVFRQGQSKDLSSMTLNQTDRPTFWAAVIHSAAESPIVGKGIGSSQAVMSDRWSWVGHPHNDYLRIWHDLGLLGLVPLLAALIVWLRTLWVELRSGATTEESGVPARLRFAGLLALVSLVIPMITDNSLVYTFVVGPVGLLVGLGLGGGALSGRPPEPIWFDRDRIVRRKRRRRR